MTATTANGGDVAPGTLSGTLWGVGVGPGDPELMTLKAHRLISGARVVAYPAPDTGPSLAREIAAGSIAAGAEEIPMIVPMRTDRFPAQEVYADAAERIAARLAAGEDVVCLCEGDPFFYGSFMYLFARLVDRFPIEVVPGVSSLGACAAALRRPLTARNDVLTVIPAPLPDAALRARIEGAQAVAIMKLGRHLGRVRRLLDELGLTAQAGYVERASLGAEAVRPLSEAPDPAPYFSMVLLYKGDDPWLS